VKQVDTILLVEDIQKSTAFYKDLLDLEILFDWKDMVVFKNRLAIHQADKLKPENITKNFIQPGKQGRNNVIVYLELEHEEITSYFKRLQNENVDVIHGIVHLPWQSLFRIYDPDGYIVEIGSQIVE
jgi:catechol 2,3-dioxygenase-like lactoylglutathione lyase family enzyme